MKHRHPIVGAGPYLAGNGQLPAPYPALHDSEQKSQLRRLSDGNETAGS
jgi:hypothetical protein